MLTFCLFFFFLGGGGGSKAQGLQGLGLYRFYRALGFMGLTGFEGL